jgi:hypothetical protein
MSFPSKKVYWSNHIKKLSYVAQKIREETQLKSQIDVIRGFENLNDGRVLIITSSISLPDAYKADFGWGKPNRDYSVIVCMHFQVGLFQLYSKYFCQDLYELFTSARL